MFRTIFDYVRPRKSPRPPFAVLMPLLMSLVFVLAGIVGLTATSSHTAVRGTLLVFSIGFPVMIIFVVLRLWSHRGVHQSTGQ
jgi:hypothetical protein